MAKLPTVIPYYFLLVNLAYECFSVTVIHRRDYDVRCLGDSQSPFRSEDGFCNNLKYSKWGRTKTGYKRYLQPHYDDGISAPRLKSYSNFSTLPNERLVSETLHDGSTAYGNEQFITLMAAQFGQFIAHDMSHATMSGVNHNGIVITPHCCKFHQREPAGIKPTSCMEITVPRNDSFYPKFGQDCLEFVRSTPVALEDNVNGMREQLNSATSFLDGSHIYGPSFGVSAGLRSFKNGQLQHGKENGIFLQGKNQLLPDDELDQMDCVVRHDDPKRDKNSVCFKAGDTRCNEQAGLTALHIIFLRLHNTIAKSLIQLNQLWDEERAYQETRKIVGAILQHITFNEFLPIVLGTGINMRQFNLRLLPSGYFGGYDAERNPQISSAFATAAFRFGHTLIQGKLLLMTPSHQNIQAVQKLQDSFSSPFTLRNNADSCNQIVRGLVGQNSQKMDRHIDAQLTNHLFARRGVPFGLDLAALNIARGRDHDLPGYNFWRKFCGLKPANSWNDLHGLLDGEAIENMKRLYNSPDDVDLYSAGISELPMLDGGLVGPTFACIIGRQFEDLRVGDRYWYENSKPEGFLPEQLQQIRRVTLASVVCSTTDTLEIQKYAMISATGSSGRNSLTDCTAIPQLDLSKWLEKRPS